MLQLRSFTLHFSIWVLLPASLAHPARNEAQIHQPVTAVTRVDPGSLVSLASNSESTITSTPSLWALELKRQNPGSITTCVPLQAYENCSPSCSSDIMATTCSSILLPFCFAIEEVFASGSTVTLLDCAATGTTLTSHVNPTTSTTITSRSSSTREIVTSSTSTVGPITLTSQASPTFPGATSGATPGNSTGIPTGMFYILFHPVPFESFSWHAQISVSAE
jgi:hypothetical protein